MKNYIKVGILSLLVGALCVLYFFRSGDNLTDVYVFETGYYDNYDEALSYTKNYPSSIVLPEVDGYYVIVAMYENIDLINEMLIYYEEKNIDVRIKKIKCDKKFVEELNRYEKIVNSIDNKELYDKLNQNILDMYISTI